MDRTWPAVYINTGNTANPVANKSKITQGIRNWYYGVGRPPMDDWWDGKKKTVTIRKTYAHKKIHRISSIDAGMWITQLFWRKEVVGGKFQIIVDAWRLLQSLFLERDYNRYFKPSEKERFMETN